MKIIETHVEPKQNVKALRAKCISTIRSFEANLNELIRWGILSPSINLSKRIIQTFHKNGEKK